MNTKIRTKWFLWGLGALAIVSIGSASLAEATGDRQGDAHEDPLPIPVRRAVAQRMIGHGAQINLVLQAGLMLDYGLVEDNAKTIAEAKLLGRPAPGERNTLAASVPTQFFELQDRLKTHATALVAAAHQHDSKKLGRELGQMLDTCIACHSTYLFQQSSGAKN